VLRGQRLNMLLTRVLSLRIIVIVAALSVVVLVITLGAWVWFGVTNDQYSQLDRRLDSVSSLGDISILLRNAQDSAVDQPALNGGGLVRTARVRNAIASVPSDIVLPQFDNGYANTTINGVEYRVRTFSAGVASIAVAAPLAETQRRIDELHRRVLLICGGVIVGTVLVGWVMWLIMINPFRLLAQQARAINAQSKPDEVQVRGVQEAVEIAEAVEGMLARIGDEQLRTRAALESARDFAAVASHELRTPLTAMRTNLEVLSTLDLRDEQRKEVVGDIIRTQIRIETMLTALERLAQGELTTVDDFVPVDITELLDRAAHDAMRSYPNLHVSLASSTTVLMVGMPAGLRLVIDNAITNAVKHGGATEIRLSAESSSDGVEIAVDDNGDGVPEEE
jgi:two-component system sensor histidine kinase PrrB